MKSILFQAQIRREKRGMSLPNIFPPQLETLLIPECALTRQKEIAGLISEELAALHGDLKTIEKKREEIKRRVDILVAATARA
jgi:hypothetical protein